MEKSDIIVGRFCLEQKAVLANLLAQYNVCTTDIACAKCDKTSLNDVLKVSLQGDEMESMAEFYYANPSLSSIGLAEASCLFMGYKKSVLVAVADPITERLCIKLGIGYMKIYTTTSINSPHSDSQHNSNHEKGTRIPAWLKHIKIACL